ncbi:hypothetical protein TRFO_08699 [Tritrichomonas foetus]|uniref:UBA domain-containing protein n=1 Tax=Tritrichomonas foetus TaxID=1144522 RepID=A0A1J4JHS8_9EUKA|nr:hypothetical protein TRFO_08699 [Tritrichomonas foetus]|eukprot:OHS98714.1 hypothetical protein TRFO_08699 [Tritrichomonas foetus]
MDFNILFKTTFREFPIKIDSLDKPFSCLRDMFWKTSKVFHVNFEFQGRLLQADDIMSECGLFNGAQIYAKPQKITKHARNNGVSAPAPLVKPLASSCQLAPRASRRTRRSSTTLDDERLVNILADSGFDKDRSRKALQMAYGNIDLAAEYMLSNKDLENRPNNSKRIRTHTVTHSLPIGCWQQSFDRLAAKGVDGITTFQVLMLSKFNEVAASKILESMA